jgi:hypothetical protein
VDVRRSAIQQEHLSDFYLACNLVQAAWGNDQPLLWNLSLLNFTLTQGQQVVTLPSNVIVVGDVYIQTQTGSAIPNNRLIYPIGRTEFASIPTPTMQAFPTSYWWDRVLPPTLNLWPVPDGTQVYTLFTYVFTQNQDAALSNGTQLAMPQRWLLALVDAAAKELSLTYAPDRFQVLSLKAAESYQLARTQEREIVPIYVTPGLASYFEP